jgi:hypothetical protein
VDGDVSIVGWEGQELVVKGDGTENRVQQDGESVTLSTDDDLSLRVPVGCSLRILEVTGDMALRGVAGSVNIGRAGGDLSIRESGPLTIETVDGDFSLRGAKGDLHVTRIEGDASIREVLGNVQLSSVEDDLVLRDVQGNLNAKVGSDVVLYLAPQAGQTCTVEAGDDILLVLPPGAEVTLTLSGDEINLDWPGVENDDSATERVVVLGSGAAAVSLRAGSEVRVSSAARAGGRPEEFGNFAGMMFDWSDFGQELGERISRRVQDVSRRAEQKAARAVRKADQKTRGPHLRGSVKVGRWNWDVQPGSFPPASMARGEPVSEEERMAILKMLQEKKITSEEADKLLAALEGGE